MFDIFRHSDCMNTFSFRKGCRLQARFTLCYVGLPFQGARVFLNPLSFFLFPVPFLLKSSNLKSLNYQILESLNPDKTRKAARQGARLRSSAPYGGFVIKKVQETPESM